MSEDKAIHTLYERLPNLLGELGRYLTYYAEDRLYLVAKAFIPNPNNYPFINHKDEDKANPDVNNLEWCTAKYNLEYNGGKERRAEPRRIKVYSVDVNGNVEHFNSITEASIAVGKSTGNICSVLRGRRKTIAGRKWFYE